MLFEYKGKIYIRVANKYIEVQVTRDAKGEYTVKPTDKKEYAEKMKNVNNVTLEMAYKIANSKIMSDDAEK